MCDILSHVQFQSVKTVCSPGKETTYFKYLVKLGVLPERRPVKQIMQYVPRMTCDAISPMQVYCLIVELLLLFFLTQ